jgi:hypothetical protein
MRAGPSVLAGFMLDPDNIMNERQLNFFVQTFITLPKFYTGRTGPSFLFRFESARRDRELPFICFLSRDHRVSLRLEGWPWSVSCPAHQEQRGRGGIICTLMEAQGHSVPAALAGAAQLCATVLLYLLVYSTIYSTITQIIYAEPGPII